MTSVYRQVVFFHEKYRPQQHVLATKAITSGAALSGNHFHPAFPSLLSFFSVDVHSHPTDIPAYTYTHTQTLTLIAIRGSITAVWEPSVGLESNLAQLASNLHMITMSLMEHYAE